MNGGCNVCGVVGFAEAIATCCKCRTSREHLYCMRVLQLKQPDQWYCQDCEPEKETTPPTRDTREDLAMASTFKMPGRVSNDTRRCADPGNFNTGLNKVSRKWENGVKGGRVKYLPVAEALTLPSGSKKSDPALITTFRSGPALSKPTGKFSSPVKNMHSIQPVNGCGRKHTADTRTQTRVGMPLKKAFSTQSPSIGYGSKTKSGNFVAKSLIAKQPRDRLSDVGCPKSAEAKAEQAMKKASPIKNTSTGFAPRIKVAPNEALSPPSLSTDSSSRIISGKSEAQANKDKQSQNIQSQNIQPRNCLGEVADARKEEVKVELVMKKASPRPNTSTVGASRMSFGGDVYSSVQHKSSEAEKDNPENFQQNEENNRLPAQDASWKGSFKMPSAELNNGLCSGIQGCPPSRVLKKVYQMSKLMPETLQFELIPRVTIWKDIFQNRCPDLDDIGLFFFPSENNRCDNYFTWIESIGKNDMAMRTCMWGVELLVFTSAHLHRSCQTWDGVHFFWGLFRVENIGISRAANRNISGPCPLNEAWERGSEGDDSQVVNMEIDMEAGVAVGVVDIVKKRKSLLGDHNGAAREPFITSITDVASAPLALSMVKEEPHNDARGIAMTPTKPLTGIAPSFKELLTSKTAVASNIPPGTPPGFDELQTSKTTVTSNIRPPPGFKELQQSKITVATDHLSPPGFNKVHTARTSVNPSKSATFSRSPGSSSANNFSPQTTNCAPGMASRKDGGLGNPLNVKIKSEKL